MLNVSEVASLTNYFNHVCTEEFVAASFISTKQQKVKAAHCSAKMAATGYNLFPVFLRNTSTLHPKWSHFDHFT